VQTTIPTRLPHILGACDASVSILIFGGRLDLPDPDRGSGQKAPKYAFYDPLQIKKSV